MAGGGPVADRPFEASVGEDGFRPHEAHTDQVRDLDRCNGRRWSRGRGWQGRSHGRQGIAGGRWRCRPAGRVAGVVAIAEGDGQEDQRREGHDPQEDQRGREDHIPAPPPWIAR